MPKKIYDIKPPKTTRKKIEKRKEVTLKESPVEVKVKKNSMATVTQENAVQKNVVHNKKEKKSFWPSLLTIIFIVAIIICVYLFFKLPKADITIWPKVDTLSFKQTVTADKSASSIDATNNIIPAKYFQSVKTASQEFPATGSASNEGKAQGTITVYNKYDPSMPFNFKAGTHFMSDSGKLFISLQKIAIPAAKKSGSKIIPGSVQINVQAVESGTDYNIAPANFSVPGLKGSAYYYSVYATSSTAMSGGYTGNVKKVTDDDIQGAKDVLTQKATTDSTSDVKSQIPSDYILLDNALLTNVTDASTQTKSGAIADKFTYQVSVQASALAFKKSDIDQLVKNYITSQIPAGKVALDNSSKVDYSSSVIDISGGKATLNLNISSGVYQDIDKNSVGISLLGENENQIKQTINSKLGDDVSKVEVKFWPFWVSSAPNNQKVVNIKFKFQ